MASIIQSIFNDKKPKLPQLEAFGFERDGARFIYSKTLTGSGFKMCVSVTPDGEVSAEVTDPAMNEPYTLHLADGAAGGFVGGVKSQYEETLLEIAASCFERNAFKSAQAKALIEYVKSAYGGELEFLWRKFPDNAVWRRGDNKKWFGALLTVSKRKLGLACDDRAEIIDLRLAPAELEALLDNERYLPGYHMNKKHWYTIILDGSVDTQELKRRIDESYLLAGR